MNGTQRMDNAQVTAVLDFWFGPLDMWDRDLRHQWSVINFGGKVVPRCVIVMPPREGKSYKLNDHNLPHRECLVDLLPALLAQSSLTHSANTRHTTHGC
jgi:hypothetical protein